MKNNYSDIIVLLENYIIVPSNFCEKILSCFGSDKSIKAASPIISQSKNMQIPLDPGKNFFQMAKLISNLSKKKYFNIKTIDTQCICITSKLLNTLDLSDINSSYIK